MTELELIKAKFEAFMNAEPLIKLASDVTLTTKDGISLVVIGGEAAVGLEINTLDADNKQTPAPAGDYELPDGRIITVGDDGKGKSVITEIADAKAEKSEEANPADAEMATDPNAPSDVAPADVQAQIDDLKNQIAALSDTIKQIVDMINGSMEKQTKMESAHNEVVVMLNSKIKDLEKQPTAVKPNLTKTFTTNEGTDSILENFRKNMAKANNENFV